MTTSLRFLDRETVAASLPPVLEQVELAGRVYRAMARGEVEMPPKIGVHPRSDAFLHAMPAYLRELDVVAMKWVSGFPDNPARGLPAISGLIIVNDTSTGVPLAVLDAAEITAARTAAASGACVQAFAPADWSVVAVLGCGEQGRYHCEVLRALEPACEIRAYDPVTERAREVCAGAVVVDDPREAVAGADIVVTAGPILRDPPSPLDESWLEDDVLLLPIDFDFYVSADAVAACDLFLTDDVAQYAAYREHGYFHSWPDAHGRVGEGLERGLGGRRVVCANLGVGALDAAFAHAVLSRIGD
ncbi:MAG: Ornithine cyclodeaminase [Thermoleophilia bacterium]|nr:Ornithine cyclodeaminase [Thermoleophilia bacterium]